MERGLQNIILEEKGESLTYVPINGGGGEPNFPTRSSRRGHASYLTRQLENAWSRAIDEAKNVVATSTRDGVYLQIEGKEGYDLVTKSLEDARQHVRLLNVNEENGVVKATVYVPITKQDFFVKKINKYADTQSGSDVITTIEKINIAMVESLWVGKRESIPGETSTWCEVWLRYETNEQPLAVVSAFFSLCTELGIEHKEKYIIFPERIVVVLNANMEHLKLLMLASGNMAEIRKMTTPVSFYTDMTAWEQKEWVEELERRVDVSKQSNTSVCILDTGVNNAHPLLKTVLKDADMHTVDVSRGVDDRRGHGTEMAGIATYYDLQEKLESMSTVEVYHYLESVKILNNSNDNGEEELYGAITQQAAYIAEAENPNANRTFCMAITSPESKEVGSGVPTSWSAAIDALLAGVNDELSDDKKRLMCISAGNTLLGEIIATEDYLSAVRLHSVENPGQAWNAITVGAYTDKTVITTPEYAGYSPVADKGGVSPFTSSSVLWERSKWPIKPEVVFEGGNLGHNPNDTSLSYSELEDLDVITTCKDFLTGKSLVATNMTSPATAQAAWMLANIQHYCPQLWPETVRGLLIHSATWTDEMIKTFIPEKHSTKNDYRNLIRVCGYGVPSLERAVYSAQNSVNLIVEDELQPFIKKVGGSNPTSNEMHMHDIPWPTDILRGLGEETVRLRVTLSYYIEPGPGQIGWKDKYRYPSCGLVFDVNNPTESKEEFQRRISKAMRDEDEDKSIVANDSSRWLIGSQNRNVGSIHSDIWEGTAADLSQSNYIMVYPTSGWWKLRTNQKKYNQKVRYSLIVSIETPESTVDLYNEIATAIKNRAVVKTEITAITRS